jgi:hypothetical protein
MNPKERAENLVGKFISHTLIFDEGAGWLEDKDEAKQCALIAVDEILNTIEYSSQADELSKISYWEEVKQEIEKL